METTGYQASNSFMRVATACPEVALADIPTNVERLSALYQEASEQSTSLLVFPEMSLTGYTIGDLVQQTALLKQAENGLSTLAQITRDKPTALVVGLPLGVGNAIYNCAAVLADGHIKGIVPKQNLPSYGEFYEKRWYQVWQQPNTVITIGSDAIPFGNALLFDISGIKTGVEICEDLWAADQPSRLLAEHGALIIANPSASPEQVGKAEYRRQLVATQSGRLMLAYLYAGCDSSESTMDIVMGGHQLIATNSRVVTERQPFTPESAPRLLYATIDVDHLKHDRYRDTNFPNKLGMQVIDCALKAQTKPVNVQVEKNFFLPEESEAERAKRFETMLNIVATGLKVRLQRSHQEYMVLGLSGGLDSTFALLVALRSANLLGKKPADCIRTLTMPGPASSKATQETAMALAQALGVPNHTVPISEITAMELELLDHMDAGQDTTYENVQARARTGLLFNYANKHRGIVLGTGDLSEIAAGWCTFNADQTAHYNVNTSLPKTSLRPLVAHIAKQPDMAAARPYLATVLATPESPELVTKQVGTLSQETNAIIGPAELRDFYLPYLVRYGDEPAKIKFLAEQAFAGMYAPVEVEKWLRVFLNRFATAQFKRSNLPDGPKVGSVALSPRGDWRMPSDLSSNALWGTT